jgi:hypothetical protein
MNYLVNGLILFFVFLICYQIFLAYFKTIEGIENKNTNGNTNQNQNQNQNQNYTNYNDPMLLAKKNAGNIMALKSLLEKLAPKMSRIDDLSGNVTKLDGEVKQLVQAQADYGHSVAGNTPPKITGT